MQTCRAKVFSFTNEAALPPAGEPRILRFALRCAGLRFGATFLPLFGCFFLLPLVFPLLFPLVFTFPPPSSLIAPSIASLLLSAR